MSDYVHYTVNGPINIMISGPGVSSGVREAWRIDRLSQDNMPTGFDFLANPYAIALDQDHAKHIVNALNHEAQGEDAEPEQEQPAPAITSEPEQEQPDTAGENKWDRLWKRIAAIEHVQDEHDIKISDLKNPPHLDWLVGRRQRLARVLEDLVGDECFVAELGQVADYTIDKRDDHLSAPLPGETPEASMVERTALWRAVIDLLRERP